MLYVTHHHCQEIADCRLQVERCFAFSLSLLQKSHRSCRIDIMGKTPKSTPSVKPGHRTVKLMSLFIIAALSAVLFAINWLVRGEAPWRAAAMAGILILVLAILRAIEPWARKRAEVLRARRASGG